MADSEVQDKRLSLIDVSFEDDCLLDSSRDPQPSGNQVVHQSLELEEAVTFEGVDNILESFAAVDQPGVHQLVQSCEPEGTGKNGKYNLRNSLAWDSAFFTSAGFLEPEEITSLIEGVEKKEKHVLPCIQEEIHRSSDSMSTLEGDCLSLASLEADLFEDIRASIQKSSKVSKKESSVSKTGALLSDKTTSQFPASKKADVGSYSQSRPKPAPKKPSLALGKTAKQLPVRPQVLQGKHSAAIGGSASFPSKPLRLGTVNSLSTSTKRDSVGAKCLRAEKSAAEHTGRGPSASRLRAMSGPRHIIPRLSSSSRSSLGSTTTKKEPESSCSSMDSSGSFSSNKIGKSVAKSNRKSIEARTANLPSTGSSKKTPSKGPDSGASHLSAYVMSASKLSSSLSPASSISEWSVESSSSTSTVNQRSNSSSTSLEPSSRRLGTADGDPPEVFDLQKSSHDKYFLRHETQGSMVPAQKNASAGGALLPSSMKPSGLRMPSPKIGFFDGTKSGRTPNGNKQSHPVGSGVLKKTTVDSVNLSGALKRGMLGKIQSETTTMPIRRTKADGKEFATDVTPKSLKESPAMGVRRVSRNLKHSSGLSPKVQSNVSPKCGEKSPVKAEDEAKECDASVQHTDSGIMGQYANGSQEIKSVSNGETLKTPSTGEGLKFFSDEVLTNIGSKAYSEDQDDLFGQVKELAMEKLVIFSPSPSNHVSENPCSVSGQVEVLNSDLFPSNSSTTDIIANTRIPFSVVDSLHNRDSSNDVSAGLQIVEVEKRAATLSSPGDISKENS
ncbi:serine-rich adhesin for platelets-like isoform X2 [Rhodamnia argentea]|uniref:Serine-rich adhesin for platelets-like isoform X2 n=1 Tax=Rhodamnia argentea TaxID=178133 RepID=A0A8B8NI37_9MYRT|nr:serine-rich adhesin for platelets-like isoform X2 [Rhodamnia argentea]